MASARLKLKVAVREAALIASRLGPLAAQTVLIALVLRRWGLADTGRLTLALSVVGLAAIFDLGVTAGATRALGVAHQQGDLSLRAAVARISLALNSVLVIVLLLGALVVRGLQGEATVYPLDFILAMIPVAFMQIQRPVFERIWLLDGEYWRLMISRGALSLVLLVGGERITQGSPRLTAMAVLFTAALAPSLLLGAGGLRRGRGSPPSTHFRQAWRLVVHQAGSLQLVTLAASLNSLADRYIVAALFGLPAAGAFDPASRSSGAQRELIAATTQVQAAQMTVFSNSQDYLSEHSGALKTATSITRRMTFVAVPALLVSPILPWLLSPDLGRDEAIMSALLAIGTTLNQLALPASIACRGLGLADLEARYSVAALVLNIGFSFVLGWRFGFVGVGVATALALAISTGYFLHLVREGEAALATWLSSLYRRERSQLVAVMLAMVGAVVQAWREPTFTPWSVAAYLGACGGAIAGLAMLRYRSQL